MQSGQAEPTCGFAAHRSMRWAKHSSSDPFSCSVERANGTYFLELLQGVTVNSVLCLFLGCVCVSWVLGGEAGPWSVGPGWMGEERWHSPLRYWPFMLLSTFIPFQNLLASRENSGQELLAVS